MRLTLTTSTFENASEDTWRLWDVIVEFFNFVGNILGAVADFIVICFEHPIPGVPVLILAVWKFRVIPLFIKLLKSASETLRNTKPDRLVGWIIFIGFIVLLSSLDLPEDEYTIMAVGAAMIASVALSYWFFGSGKGKLSGPTAAEPPSKEGPRK